MSLDPRYFAVLRCEFVRLLRDRRALFLAVVLPMALYPLYFLGIDALEGESERRRADEVVRLLADLYAAPPEVAEEIRTALDATENLEWSSRPWADGADPESVDELEARIAEAGTQAETLGWLVARRGEAGLSLELWYDGSDESSGELSGRVRRSLGESRDAWVERELSARLAPDPAQEFALERDDRAEPVDAAGAGLGRFLPIVAVLILVSGGAYAALDAFAAEREQGTLETLLVQPVPVHVVGWAKFTAVAVCSALALLGNLGSLVACAATGLVPVAIDDADLSGAVLGPLFAGRLALALLVAAPGMLLVSAVLCAFSARARTFREAQTLVFPITIFAALATAPATLPGVELVPTLAAIPMVGTALAMREALAGHLGLLPALLSILSSGAAAVFALRRVGQLLDLEGLLQHGDTEAEGVARERRARRAISFGFACVFAIYFVGSWLQSEHLVGGLLATLWGIALGGAVLLAQLQAQSPSQGERGSAVRELALRGASAATWLAVPLLAVGLVALAKLLFEWQSTVLPLPRSALVEVEELSRLAPLAALALLALSPAVCEELLFRGAITSGLLRDFTALRSVLWQAALFALAHASVHRFLPIFAVGLALGLVRVRGGSILPCILLHFLYNGSIVLPDLLPEDSGVENWLAHPALLLALPLGVLVLLRGRAARGTVTAS